MNKRIKMELSVKTQVKASLKVTLLKGFVLTSIVGIIVFAGVMIYNTFFSAKKSRAETNAILPGGIYKIGGTGSTPSNGCSYVDLSAAAAALNTSTITGTIELVLTDTYTSTEENSFPITLNSINGASANNRIIIRPDANTSPEITGSSAQSIIKFNGTNYFTIEGSKNGSSSRDLSVINTSIANNSAAIWISSLGTAQGATNISINNTNIKAGIGDDWSKQTFGIFIGGTAIANTLGAVNVGNNNDYISILNNSISRSTWGIWGSGGTGSTSKINNLVISNNLIGSENSAEYIGYIGISLNEINSSKINGNTIKNIISSIGNNESERPTGLYIGNCFNSAVSGNNISTISYTGTGSYGVKGIEIRGKSNNTNYNLTISNNVICDLSGKGSSSIGSSSVGLKINASGLKMGGINIFNNSIYLSGSNSSSSVKTACIHISSGTVTNIDMRNNAIINTIASSNPKSYCLYSEVAKSSFSDINFNDYFSSKNGFLCFLAGDETSLSSWATATGDDQRSINGDPEFVSHTNLIPDSTKSSSLVLNGNATQIATINTDIRNIPRSTSPNAGIPDIGAYEFIPKPEIIPTSTIQSANPANNVTSKYYFFNQLVASVTWHGSNFPSITMKYYSDATPDSVGTGNRSYIYWNIQATGGTNYTYDIEFPYNPAILGTINLEGDIIIAKKHGSEPWENFTSSVVNTTTKTVKISGLSSFSKFILSDKKNPLPVELISFAAEKDNDVVLLKWKTASETNNDYFTIERSVNGLSFENIGTIKGAGNSNSLSAYSYSDEIPLKPIGYYRLKQTDYDGKFTYSSIISLKLDKDNTSVPLEIETYGPNPVTDYFLINYYCQTEEKAMLNIYSLDGKKVYAETFLAAEGVNTFSTQNLISISKGIYLFNITTQTHASDFVKIIKS